MLSNIDGVNQLLYSLQEIGGHLRRTGQGVPAELVELYQHATERRGEMATNVLVNPSRPLDAAVERVRAEKQLWSDYNRGEPSGWAGLQRGLAALRAHGGASRDPLVRMLADLPDRERAEVVRTLPEQAAAAGMSVPQFVESNRKAIAARERHIGGLSEAEAASILKGLELRRDKGHTAKGTLGKILNELVEGGTDITRSLPFDGKPKSYDRTATLDAAARNWADTPLGRQMARRGQSLRDTLAEAVAKAQDARTAALLTGKLAARDMERPKVVEKPTRERRSELIRREHIRAQVNAHGLGNESKPRIADNTRQAVIRNLVAIHEGKDDAQIAKEVIIPADIEAELREKNPELNARIEESEHTLERQEHREDLRASIEAAYQQNQ
jgi:hypothetical protein